jgi:hypothetical protein
MGIAGTWFMEERQVEAAVGRRLDGSIGSMSSTHHLHRQIQLP